MKVKIIATVIADIDVFPDDVLNSDTIADYVTQLDCDIDNAALEYLSKHLKNVDIEINMTEPEFYDGIEEYGKLINNWQSEYNERSKI